MFCADKGMAGKQVCFTTDRSRQTGPIAPTPRPGSNTTESSVARPLAASQSPRMLAKRRQLGIDPGRTIQSSVRSGHMKPLLLPGQRSSESNQLHPFKARVPVADNDDVVVHRNSERPGDLEDLPGLSSPPTVRHLAITAGAATENAGPCAPLPARVR
jgi:hypothetical protein